MNNGGLNQGDLLPVAPDKKKTFFRGMINRVLSLRKKGKPEEKTLYEQLLEQSKVSLGTRELPTEGPLWPNVVSDQFIKDLLGLSDTEIKSIKENSGLYERDEEHNKLEIGNPIEIGERIRESSPLNTKKVNLILAKELYELTQFHQKQSEWADLQKKGGLTDDELRIITCQYPSSLTEKLEKIYKLLSQGNTGSTMLTIAANPSQINVSKDPEKTKSLSLPEGDIYQLLYKQAVQELHNQLFELYLKKSISHFDPEAQTTIKNQFKESLKGKMNVATLIDEYLNTLSSKLTKNRKKIKSLQSKINVLETEISEINPKNEKGNSRIKDSKRTEKNTSRNHEEIKKIKSKISEATKEAYQKTRSEIPTIEEMKLMQKKEALTDAIKNWEGSQWRTAERLQGFYDLNKALIKKANQGEIQIPEDHMDMVIKCVAGYATHRKLSEADQKPWRNFYLRLVQEKYKVPTELFNKIDNKETLATQWASKNPTTTKEFLDFSTTTAGRIAYNAIGSNIIGLINNTFRSYSGSHGPQSTKNNTQSSHLPPASSTPKRTSNPPSTIGRVSRPPEKVSFRPTVSKSLEALVVNGKLNKAKFEQWVDQEDAQKASRTIESLLNKGKITQQEHNLLQLWIGIHKNPQTKVSSIGPSKPRTTTPVPTTYSYEETPPATNTPNLNERLQKRVDKRSIGTHTSAPQTPSSDSFSHQPSRSVSNRPPSNVDSTVSTGSNNARHSSKTSQYPSYATNAYEEEPELPPNEKELQKQFNSYVQGEAMEEMSTEEELETVNKASKFI